jgi:hypothetical protein
LAERPLRLYDVTNVVPGQQLTLCDSLDTQAPPIIVREKSGSQASMLGIRIGVRIMEVDGHYELSGGAYPFSPLGRAGRRGENAPGHGPLRRASSELRHLLGGIIQRQWLAQFYAPLPMPAFRDAYSGEPILLITDHYRVKDWAALTQSLSAQSDVEGDRESGWNRLIDCTDGQTRSVATINVEKVADKITTFYKTQRYADEGRRWFESVAGGAVRFLSRELSDPAGLLRNRPAGQGSEARRDAGPDLSPQALAELVEDDAPADVRQVARRAHPGARWPDPAAGDQTRPQGWNVSRVLIAHV